MRKPCFFIFFFHFETCLCFYFLFLRAISNVTQSQVKKSALLHQFKIHKNVKQYVEIVDLKVLFQYQCLVCFQIISAVLICSAVIFLLFCLKSAVKPDWCQLLPNRSCTSAAAQCQKHLIITQEPLKTFKNLYVCVIGVL